MEKTFYEKINKETLEEYLHDLTIAENKDRSFMVYGGKGVEKQWNEALLTQIYGVGWISLYKEDKLKIYSKEDIDKKIKKNSLDSAKIWGMCKSEDIEIIKLVSEILNM